MRLPKTVGTCADKLYEMQQERKQLNAQIDAIKANEAELKEHAQKLLRQQKTSEAKGRSGAISITTEVVASEINWEKVFAWVAENDAWEMLTRRMNNAAYRERLEEGEKVPGTTPLTRLKVNVRKAA